MKIFIWYYKSKYITISTNLTDEIIERIIPEFNTILSRGIEILLLLYGNMSGSVNWEDLSTIESFTISHTYNDKNNIF